MSALAFVQMMWFILLLEQQNVVTILQLLRFQISR